MAIDFQNVFKVTITLFTVIDIVGVLPLLIDITRKTGKIHPEKATMTSLIILLATLLLGDSLLAFLGVSRSSFAVAGGIILFLLAMEMILGRDIFKSSDHSHKVSSIVPVAFPLISGAGTMTTILSLKTQFEEVEILIAILINIIIVYIVLRYMHKIQEMISETTIQVMRKLFGVILLAIAVGIISKNLA
ncbi:MAG: NAAT family transporter [Chitinophagales bacterium]|jgi:multiple antibiotic resistance protein|nr:NAAT family transporter [Chitinophagales bacterium]